MGRQKRKADDEREPFQVRLTKAEKLEIEMAAIYDGLPTSTWMRVKCLEVARKSKEKVA